MLMMNKIILVGRVLDKGKLIGGKFINIDTLTYDFIGIYRFNEVFSKYNVLNCSYINNSLRSKRKSIHLRMLSVYNKRGILVKQGYYTESQLVSFETGIHQDTISYRICGALVSGAIDDEYSENAERHAKMYYNEIRSRSTDVDIIARRLGKTKEEILKVKNYLFMDYHNLETGYKRFDPHISIAQSWQRLSDKNMIIQRHDKILIEHELMELSLVESGLSQSEAHRYAQNEYNYQKESDEYYDKIREHKNK